VRAAPRTRIERTEQVFQAIENAIRQHIPARDLGSILDNIGLPERVYNLAFTDGTTIGVNDGQILISLKEGHAPTAAYIRKLRQELHRDFPDVLFYFQPADIVTQILNFGVPSQIDVQVQGQDRSGNIAVAQELRRRIAEVPGVVDAHIHQELDAPELYYTIDRTRAQQLGLSLVGIANNLNISLSSSEQVSTQLLDRSEVGNSLLSRGADARVPQRRHERSQ
jgi:multidrug efflux pump subunit AcrB